MKRVIVLLYVFGSLGILTSCSKINSLPLEENCSINHLLLDETDFYPNTIFDEVYSPIEGKPRQSAGQSVYYKDSWIYQTVIHYSTDKVAQEEYSEARKSIFFTC